MWCESRQRTLNLVGLAPEPLVNHYLLKYDPYDRALWGALEMKMSAAELTLEKELETYRGLLPSLSSEEGRFALIADDKLLGIFDTYGDALEAGYRLRELKPFLVKQIATYEVIANFSRDITRTCHTSPAP